jgi:hypothetical protein
MPLPMLAPADRPAAACVACSSRRCGVNCSHLASTNFPAAYVTAVACAHAAEVTGQGTSCVRRKEGDLPATGAALQSAGPAAAAVKLVPEATAPCHVALVVPSGWRQSHRTGSHLRHDTHATSDHPQAHTLQAYWYVHPEGAALDSYVHTQHVAEGF